MHMRAGHQAPGHPHMHATSRIRTCAYVYVDTERCLSELELVESLSSLRLSLYT